MPAETLVADGDGDDYSRLGTEEAELFANSRHSDEGAVFDVVEVGGVAGEEGFDALGSRAARGGMDAVMGMRRAGRIATGHIVPRYQTPRLRLN
jgi:hypothetical protein